MCSLYGSNLDEILGIPLSVSLSIHTKGEDGQVRHSYEPSEIYTTLSFLLNGGAKFLAYGIGHFVPLPDESGSVGTSE